jgi:hypothetical protein
VGNADAGAQANGGFSGAAIAKMIAVNAFQDWVSKRKWSFKFKLFVFVMVFVANLYYNTQQFIDKRS